MSIKPTPEQDPPPYPPAAWTTTKMDDCYDESPTVRRLFENSKTTDESTLATPARAPPPPLPLMHKFFTPPPPDGFPHIHQSHPGQPFTGHTEESVDQWLAVPGHKAIVRIFNYPRVMYADPSLPRVLLEESIRSIITHAIPDSPRPLCHPPPRNLPGSIPSTILVTLPSEKAHRTLLRGRIWSSEWITFEALPVRTAPPTALIAIAPFPTNNPSYPKKYIGTVWANPKNAKRIAEALLGPEDPDLTTEGILDHLLSSLAADPFPSPRGPGYGFVIHASTWRNDITLWTRLRKILFSLDYPPTPKLGHIALVPLPYCSLCHSASHVRPNCPFPKLPLWNGPS